MPATQYTNEYRYEARFTASDVAPGEWVEIDEESVRANLAVETPDPRELNDVLIAMRKGATADLPGIEFRAVPIPRQAELRVAYTTAPAAYDGFGTVELVQVAGTDQQGRVIRKVGIRPEHGEWQTQRYGSGMHLTVAEDLVLGSKYADIWTMTE